MKGEWIMKQLQQREEIRARKDTKHVSNGFAMALLFGLLSCATGVMAAETRLEPGFQVTSGSVVIDVGIAHPAASDWNNDGLQDLILGTTSPDGNIRVYLNTGTEFEPAFDGFTNVQSGGRDIVDQANC
jgi:hypothetical protein